LNSLSHADASQFMCWNADVRPECICQWFIADKHLSREFHVLLTARIPWPLKLHNVFYLKVRDWALNSMNKFANSVVLITVNSVGLPGATVFFENLQQRQGGEDNDNNLNLFGACSNLCHFKDARAKGRKPTNSISAAHQPPYSRSVYLRCHSHCSQTEHWSLLIYCLLRNERVGWQCTRHGIWTEAHLNLGAVNSDGMPLSPYSDAQTSPLMVTVKEVFKHYRRIGCCRKLKGDACNRQ
jgi:hypothetical protein